MCGGWIKEHKKELLGAAAVGGGIAAMNPALLAGLFGTEAAAGGAAGGLLAGGESGGALGAGLIAEDLAGVVGSESAKGGLLGNLAFAAGGKAGPAMAGRLGLAAMMSQAGGREQGPQIPPYPSGVQPMPPGQSAPPLSETHPVNVIDPEKRRRLARLMAMQGRQYGA